MTNDPQTLLSNARCYVCQGASTEQALELALLAQIAGETVTLQVIVNGTLTWVWAGTNPDHWEIQYSLDGVTNWNINRTVAGNVRTDPIIDGDVFVRIVGANALNQIITPFSNVEFSA